MQPGDLVRYRTVLRHDCPQELSEWKLGVLVGREFNLAKALIKEGKVVKLWAYLVQKAGKKIRRLKMISYEEVMMMVFGVVFLVVGGTILYARKVK